jgi:hypothetical protein
LFVLIFTCLFSTSCVFDVDKAVNLNNSFSVKYTIQENSTLFYFDYTSQERPIEDYQVIKARINYYKDYTTRMKKKDVFITVPDDVQYKEDGQAYFVAEIGDALGEQSVIASIMVEGNYKVSKSENASRVVAYVVASIVAVVLLIGLCSIYAAICSVCDSNSLMASLEWIGSMIVYLIATLIIGALWQTGPASIVICSAILFAIVTIIPFIKYKS